MVNPETLTLIKSLMGKKIFWSKVVPVEVWFMLAHCDTKFNRCFLLLFCLCPCPCSCPILLYLRRSWTWTNEHRHGHGPGCPYVDMDMDMDINMDINMDTDRLYITDSEITYLHYFTYICIYIQNWQR